MNPIDTLTEYFGEFPGIGPRQAKRFVYFLIAKNPRFLKELARHIETLVQTRAVCDSCFRYFVKNSRPGANSLCVVCANPNRSPETLIVVGREVDAENIERSGAYLGRYFILGGNLSLLENTPAHRAKSNGRTLERLEKLVKTVDRQSDEGLKEIVLAFAVNPEGEHTAHYIGKLLAPLCKTKGISITTLGRGLSTGTELEYPDSETIKNALQNRR